MSKPIAKSIAKPSAKAQVKAKPRKFTDAAKTMVTALSASALIGGWNWIGHLEVLKTQTVQAASQVAQATTGAQPTPPQPTATPWPTIPALVIPPVATLSPLRAQFSQTLSNTLNSQASNAGQSDNSALANVPLVQALAPLPTFAPLPALPALPPVAAVPAPSINSGSGNSSSGSSHHGRHSGGS